MVVVPTRDSSPFKNRHWLAEIRMIRISYKSLKQGGPAWAPAMLDGTIVIFEYLPSPCLVPLSTVVYYYTLEIYINHVSHSSYKVPFILVMPFLLFGGWLRSTRKSRVKRSKEGFVFLHDDMCLAGRICRLFTLGTGACDCEALVWGVDSTTFIATKWRRCGNGTRLSTWKLSSAIVKSVMLVLTFTKGREWENGKMIEAFWWRRAQDWNQATCLFTRFTVSAFFIQTLLLGFIAQVVLSNIVTCTLLYTVNLESFCRPRKFMPFAVWAPKACMRNKVARQKSCWPMKEAPLCPIFFWAYSFYKLATK